MVIETAKKVLKIEADAVAALIDRIDGKFIEAIDILKNCKGRIIVTGMGKGGLIGRKISATLASTGAPSLFLHPAEAIHGDLGMVQKEDAVIAISNSGETEEVTKLLPLLKRIGSKMIVLTGNIESTLAKYSDVVLDVSVEKEACSFGLVPTSSTTAALAMGDALAVILYENKGFKIEDYAFYHPGGSLGKKMLLKVDDIMKTGNDNPVVSETMILKDVLLLITEAKAGAAIVVDDAKRLSGIFTDGDLRRSLDKYKGDLLTKTVGEVMTKNPRSIISDSLASEALRIIKESNIDEIPVVDSKGAPVGLVDEKDLLGLE